MALWLSQNLPETIGSKLERNAASTNTISVTVAYADQEQFGRTFNDKARAEKYAARQ